MKTIYQMLALATLSAGLCSAQMFKETVPACRTNLTVWDSSTGIYLERVSQLPYDELTLRTRYLLSCKGMDRGNAKDYERLMGIYSAFAIGRVQLFLQRKGLWGEFRSFDQAEIARHP